MRCSGFRRCRQFYGLTRALIRGLTERSTRGLVPPRLNELQQILNDFDSPEQINDSPMTAPSKRLINLFPGYEKVVFGELVASQIGLEVIRERCRHFHAWVTTLEQLGT